MEKFSQPADENGHVLLATWVLGISLDNYASPSSGEAYRDRQLTINFEF